MSEQSLGDATIAVVAHGLLQSVTVIRGAAATLREHWAELDHDARQSLLEKVDTQAEYVAGVLADLVQMLPSSARAVLESLGDKQL